MRGSTQCCNGQMGLQGEDSSFFLTLAAMTPKSLFRQECFALRPIAGNVEGTTGDDRLLE